MTKEDIEKFNDTELLDVRNFTIAQGMLLSTTDKKVDKELLDEVTALSEQITVVATERDLLKENGDLTEKGIAAKSVITEVSSASKASDRLNRKYGNFDNVNNANDSNNDILWGAIWCGGGIAATLADIGYIFWGAIIYGGIKLISGIVSSNQR